jgi:murein DD-endopeptidase MepM/ murein hydrolase activator NlpD
MERQEANGPRTPDLPMNSEPTPVVVAFPLRGEGWVAVNSPADRFPSHGTDMLGQRYAFDFMRTDERRREHYHPAGWPRTALAGVPTRECYAWCAPILAPFDGEVVRAVDGIPERARVHPLRELGIVLRNALTFTPARLPAVLGNHVILRRGDLFAGFAHLAPGSVAVREGQGVRRGDAWIGVERGIPGKRDRVRVIDVGA